MAQHQSHQSFTDDGKTLRLRQQFDLEFNPKSIGDVLRFRRIKKKNAEETNSQGSHVSAKNASEDDITEQLEAIEAVIETSFGYMEERLTKQFVDLTKRVEDLHSQIISLLSPRDANLRICRRCHQGSPLLALPHRAVGGKASLGNVSKSRIPELAAATFSEEEPCPPASASNLPGPVLLGSLPLPPALSTANLSTQAIADEKETVSGSTGPSIVPHLERKVSVITGGSSSQYSGSQSSQITVNTRASAFATYFNKDLSHIRSRYKLYDEIWYFLNEPESSVSALWFARLFPILICLSVLLSYIPHEASEPFDAWSVLDFAFDVTFCLLFITRFIVCPNRCTFVHNFHNWVDLFAGPPVLILRCITYSGVFDGYQDGLQALVRGTVPVLRLLKVLRQFETFTLLTSAFKIAFEALPVLLFTLTILITIFTALFWYFEPRDNVPDLQVSCYLTIMTLTSVGYGDLFPVTAAGRIVSCFLSIVGALYMAIPLGIVGTAFSNAWDDRDRLLLVSRARRCLLQIGCTGKCIPELFFTFDIDKDGQLSMEEFKNMLAELRIGIREERMLSLFRAVDRDGNGVIDDQEFVRALFPKDFAEIYRGSRSWSSETSLELTGINTGASSGLY